jgi:hypothetical protein
MKRFFSRFKADDTGVMTLEFMILLPVILMWFAAVFVFFDAFHKWMKSLKASYTVSDLISRQLEVDDAYIFALDSIYDKISQSKNNDDTWLRVSQVRLIDDVLELMWTTPTYTGSDGGVDPFSVEDVRVHIPAIENNEYLIVVQTYRPFNPVFDWVGIAATTFSNTIVSPLRFSSSLINHDHPITSATTDEGIDTDDPEEAS